MVQTDLSQLSAESTEWRQILRSYREEFGDSKKSLQSFCRQSLSKPQLLDVEHFENQFHIQLINIHDLKQQIKAHERELSLKGDAVSDETFARHEHLLDEFVTLENTLQELRQEFQSFTNDTAC